MRPVFVGRFPARLLRIRLRVASEFESQEVTGRQDQKEMFRSRLLLTAGASLERDGEGG